MNWIQWYFASILGVGAFFNIVDIVKGKGIPARSHEKNTIISILSYLMMLPVIGRIFGWW